MLYQTFFLQNFIVFPFLPSSTNLQLVTVFRLDKGFAGTEEPVLILTYLCKSRRLHCLFRWA